MFKSKSLTNILLAWLCIFFSSVANADKNPKRTFNLQDAIFLAVRSNPNVQSIELTHVLNKFNLHIQEWMFAPHYAFEATAMYAKKKSNGNQGAGSHVYNLKPSVSLLTPIGTKISLGAINPIASNYNPGVSLDIVQPLMRGFGRAIVETALNNARDTEVISRLNIEGTLRSTVTAVIEAYLEVVAAEKTILIDEAALKRATQSVLQTKLFIKAGRKAGNELVTVEANVATAQTQLENDKNTLHQTQYALLTAIGVDPNADIIFTPLNIPELIKKYRLPKIAQVKKLVLANDIPYQTAQITLHGSTARSLVVAKDNARWQLDFSANLATGNGAGGGFNAGTNSLFNRENHHRQVGFMLKIPIDNQLAEQAILSAKIALRQAELALKREKWSKETSAINAFNLVVSAERALHFAENAERLQKKTYNISFQKYLHGLIDSVELQSVQFTLIQSEQTLLRAQIGYLKALVQLDNLIGHTLNTWNVGVRL